MQSHSRTVVPHMLSHSRPIGLRLCLLVLPLALAACHPKERAAQRIASQNAAARGGLKAWRAVHSLWMSGQLEAGVPRDPVKLAAAAVRSPRVRRADLARAIASDAGTGGTVEKRTQLPFVMEVARPRRSRLEIKFNGETAVQVFDGKQGWKLRPFLGRREVESYTADEQRLALQQTDLDGPLMDYVARHCKLELVKTEKVEGRDAHKIAVTLENGDVRHVWVDVASSLEVMTDGSRRLDGKQQNVWTYLRDYKEVGGLMIPHLIETTVDSVPGSERIVIEHLAINPELPADHFSSASLVAAAAAPAAGEAAKAATAPGAAAVPTAPAAPVQLMALPSAPLKRAKRTPADYKVPAVNVVRSDGQTVPFNAEVDDGRLVVLDFIFTTCQGICPVMSQTFSQLQGKLGADRDKVHLISVSIDPEQDTPARMAEYARKFHSGPEWTHYTGTTEASVAVQRAFDAYRGDKMDHTPVTFVRSAPGQRWDRLDGFVSPEELAREIRDLLAAR
jgi:protein SCO1/2